MNQRILFTTTFNKIEKYEILDKNQAYKYAIISMKFKLCFYYEMGVSGNLWIVVKDVKTLVVYDVE